MPAGFRQSTLRAVKGKRKHEMDSERQRRDGWQHQWDAFTAFSQLSIAANPTKMQTSTTLEHENSRKHKYLDAVSPGVPWGAGETGSGGKGMGTGRGRPSRALGDVALPRLGSAWEPSPKGACAREKWSGLKNK